MAEGEGAPVPARVNSEQAAVRGEPSLNEPVPSAAYPRANDTHTEVLGIRMVTDASVPRDEIHFKQGERLVGKIIGIGEADVAYESATERTFWPGFSRNEVAECVILAAMIAALVFRVIWLFLTAGA